MAVWTIDEVLIGTVGEFGPGGRKSAIRKRQAERPLRITTTGLEGDEHGDLVHHGGADQAVHHYAFDNYSYWRSEFPEIADRFSKPGFFGENLSSRGFDEADLCVGDTFRVGTALLQVSQARQPCWKLAHRSGIENFALRVQEAARTGWFYRVLEPGMVSAGDEMRLEDRPNPSWSLKRLLTAMYHSPLVHSELEGMAALRELSPGWREIAEHRIASGTVESWHSRVTIPSA